MESLVHPKERIYFGISLTISLLVYLLLVVSIVGIAWIALGAFLALIANGLFIGSLRGNSIRVSERQFPEVHRLVQEISGQMGQDPVPAVYVMQAGGLLNAFATRFLGRNFVVIFSDVLELAYEKGESALAFVICHELAHVKRKHLARRWLLFPSMMIPFLNTAYSRACEYTCDRFGLHYQPNGAVAGLLVLAAGKKLYQNVDPAEFSSQADQEGGFWIWFAEILSTHPNLPKRVRALRQVERLPYAEYAQLGTQSLTARQN